MLPSRATSGSAGYDLYTITPGRIPAFSWILICTGLAIAAPPGTYLRIAPKSSLALQYIDIAGGVADGDYRGELQIIATNFSCRPFNFTAKKPMAQLIVEKILTPEVEQVDTLSTNIRGKGGLEAPIPPKISKVRIRIFQLFQPQVFPPALVSNCTFHLLDLP